MLASMLAILIVAIMSLDHTRKLSPKKINIWTVTIMMIIAAVQAYHKTQTLMYRVSGDELIWNKIIVFIQLIAGMLIVVYMCDRATKYGIGGKVSVFMVNMVSGMMTMFTGKPLEKLALPVAIGVAEIAVMIVLETTEKRIAVQRVSINNIYADKNYIAYKLNPVGATPLMFASAAFLLPQFMCNGLHYLFPDNADIQWWMDNMRLTSPLGIVVYMVIICLLTIIFSMVMLSPGRTADDLLKSGDSIQDIYAGKPTKRYLIGTVAQLFRYKFNHYLYMSGWTAVFTVWGICGRITCYAAVLYHDDDRSLDFAVPRGRGVPEYGQISYIHIAPGALN